MHALLLALLITAPEAQAQTYLIAIGNNAVPAAWQEKELTPLRFADDDALAFFEYAAQVGWSATLLTVPDEETQRRFPSSAPLARPPTLPELRQVIAQHQQRLRTDHEEGRQSELVVFFSGHGRKGDPALALLDESITQRVLYEEILGALPARYVHLFIDACHAESVVRARGLPAEVSAEVVSVTPTDVQKWIEHNSLSRFPQVGAMIATAQDAKTHEWDLLGRGVFTHEVLSGLRGAADVNSDGRIEYSELHAFVSSANREVDAPQAKLEVLTRTPEINLRAPIVDLRRSNLSWLISDYRLGRFFIEDGRGTRLVDAHAEPGHRVRLLVPPQVPLRLVTSKGEATFEISAGEELDLGELDLTPPSIRSRGAIANALERGLFSSSYGPLYYRGFIDRRGGIAVSFNPPAEESSSSVPAIVAWGSAGALVVAASVFGVLALDAKGDFNNTDFMVPARDAEDRYNTHRTGFFITLSGAVVATAVGALLYPWE